MKTLILLFVSVAAFGHRGGYDSFGCHHNRVIEELTGKTEYHCHVGEYDGKVYNNIREFFKDYKKNEERVLHKKKTSQR